MRIIFKTLMVALLLCQSASIAATHVVTIANGNNPWAPTAGSFAEAVVNAQNSGDTIVFDYVALGNSPTITLETGFNSYGMGGFVVDGLRDLPVASDLVKFVSAGSPGAFASLMLISNNNTTLIGLDLGPVAGNGIFITSSNNTIDTCYVHDCNYHGINISNAGSNNTVKNSLIYNNNQTALTNVDHENAGIYSLGASTVVDSCYIYGNGANGILIRNAAAANPRITNSVIGRDIAGTELGNNWNGIFIWAANGAVIENNVIVNNGQTPNGDASRLSGIRFQELTSGAINQNYIGTDAAKVSAGNAFDGITLHTNVSNVDITSNIICHNGFLSTYGAGGGIALRNNSNQVTMTSNFVGAHADGTDGGNNDYGIDIEGGNNIMIGGNAPADGNTIGYSKRAPSIGASRGCGIWLVLAGTTGNEVYNNNIINNAGPGIEIERDAQGNIIGASGQGNNIAGNQYGILVHTSNAVQNTLRYNSFSCNTVQGISLQNGGNNEYGKGTAPGEVLVNSTEKRADWVSGFAPSANATVDVYVADNLCPMDCENTINQGMTMVTTVTAAATPSPNGLYKWEYDFVAGGNLVNKTNVIVLATENGVAGAVNTSEFSVCAVLCNIPENASISSADLDLCPDENTVLTANSTGKADGEDYSFSWYVGSIDPSNLVHYALNDSDLTVNTAGVYIVEISSQLDSASCTDTTTTATVVVNSQPTINLVPASNNVCTGDSVLLDAGTSGANLSIVWRPNGETTNSVYVKSGDTYEVVVVNTVTTCRDSATTTITESAPPVIDVTAPFFCQGDSTLVDAGVAGLNYAWTPSGNTTQSFYVSTEGTHDVVVTDPATNCSTAGSILADQSPDPKPSVVLPADTFMCLLQGQTVDILATVTTSTPGGLLWSDGTVDDTLFTATDTIVYIAVYSDSFGCTGADTIEVMNACSTPDPLVPNIVTINNPWTPFGEITPDQFIKSDFVVYDRWGLEMYTTTDILPKWTGENKKGNKCSSGVYFWVWKYTDVTGEEKHLNGFLQLVKYD